MSREIQRSSGITFTRRALVCQWPLSYGSDIRLGMDRQPATAQQRGVRVGFLALYAHASAAPAGSTAQAPRPRRQTVPKKHFPKNPTEPKVIFTHQRGSAKGFYCVAELDLECWRSDGKYCNVGRRNTGPIRSGNGFSTSRGCQISRPYPT